MAAAAVATATAATTTAAAAGTTTAATRLAAAATAGNGIQFAKIKLRHCFTPLRTTVVMIGHRSPEGLPHENLAQIKAEKSS